MSLSRSTRRFVTRAAIPLTAVTLLVAAAGCSSDVITAPDSAFVRRDALVTPAVATGLLRTKPLLTRQTASATIGPGGGTLSLPEAGLRVVVPMGALSTPTKLSVTANPGVIVAYTFQPHGTVFNAPLVLTQDLTNTAWVGSFWYQPPLKAGYFADESQLTATTTRLYVNEVLPVTTDIRTTPTATFNVYHFSGYIIATGVRGGGT